MALIPAPALAALPGLEVDLPDDPLVHIRLTHPVGATWRVIAASRSADGDWLLFVHADLGEPELGYASLRELEDVDVDGLRIERDLSFIPVPLSEAVRRSAMPSTTREAIEA